MHAASRDDSCYIASAASHDDSCYVAIRREDEVAHTPRFGLVSFVGLSLVAGVVLIAATNSLPVVWLAEQEKKVDISGQAFYGPMTFDAEPGQALNKDKTVGQYVAPAKVLFHRVNGERTRFGSAQFSNASVWNGGDAKMMLGFILVDKAGVQRDVHWHTKGDEWAYVIKGTWTLTMAAPTEFSPDGRKKSKVPWKVTYGHSGPDSVWYFPRGWWHTIVCETPSGCAAMLFFNSPPSVRPELNSPQLAQAMHGGKHGGSFGPNGMPTYLAAHVLGSSSKAAKEVQDRLAGHSASDDQSEYLLNSIFDLTNACNPNTSHCPQLPAADTPDGMLPAVVQMKSGKGTNTRTWPFFPGGEWLSCGRAGASDGQPRGDEGFDGGDDATPEAAIPDYAAVTAWDVTASNGFPLLGLSSQAGRGGSAGEGISGQLIELQPGATRPPVWTLNADAILFVVYGTITLTIYVGDEFTGFAPTESQEIDPSAQIEKLVLSANQAAYIPINNLYYFTAGCDSGGAKVTIAFNHPEWEEIGMKESLALFPRYEIQGSLNDPGKPSSKSGIAGGN